MENKTKKLYIDDYVFKISDDPATLEQTLWNQAFECGIGHLYNQLGWQGGTIHQVRDKIMEYKIKWNKGSR